MYVVPQMQRNCIYEGLTVSYTHRFSTVRRVSSSNLYMTLEQESTILNTTCYATGTFLDGAAASVTPTTALTKYFMHNSIIIPSSGLQLLSKASKNKDNY